MKMLLVCPECHPGLKGVFPTLEHAEITDDGYYVHTCMNGHTSLIVNQQQKFEILFENGAHAMIDGYYRESILSFAASLERFYEFFIRLINRANKVDLSVFNETWRLVASQSERQLGAYIFLYLNTFREAPQLLPSGKVSLRNNVAHKGYIPKRQEAIDYGQSVLNIIYTTLARLKVDYQDVLSDEIFSRIEIGYEKARRQGLKPSTFYSSTIISINDASAQERILEEEIHKLTERREMERQAADYLGHINKFGQALVSNIKKT